MSDHEHFHKAYEGGAAPPWDIGRPQPALVEAERRGWVRGAVLDAGCGTGEHALFFAAAGHDVVGVDVAPAAIARAVAKATERGLPNPPRFVVADVLKEPQAFDDRTYDTVVDMGFFHTLDDRERSTWRSLLARLLAPGGGYVMLCFSELVPGSCGPRRISETDIRETFGADEGFAVTDLERTELQTNRGAAGVAVQAWLTRIERV
jgi:SAM-dependent methyltransferase